jgi:hypothetical protein
VLAALSGFRSKREASALAALANAKTPEEAYAAACEYRGMLAFTREAEAAVKIGDAALNQMKEEMR